MSELDETDVAAIFEEYGVPLPTPSRPDFPAKPAAAPTSHFLWLRPPQHDALYANDKRALLASVDAEPGHMVSVLRTSALGNPDRRWCFRRVTYVELAVAPTPDRPALHLISLETVRSKRLGSEVTSWLAEASIFVVTQRVERLTVT